jgi:hypothetical protein
MLQSWFHHHFRTLTDTEILCFSLLLGAPKSGIEAHMQDLILRKGSLGKSNDGSDQDWRIADQPASGDCRDMHRPEVLVAVTPANFGTLMHPFNRTSFLQSEIGHFERFNHSVASLQISNSHRNPRHATLALASTHKQHSGAVPSTKALKQLIRSFIHTSIMTGCKQNAHQRTQLGIYACTLGCGYRSKRYSDTFRHEQSVYPQQFWFCFLCGDPKKPSERHLFTREDKLQKHIHSFHRGVIKARQCQITGVRPIFPDRCEICLHHRHATWKQRCEHIVWHYQSGHIFPPVMSTRRQSNTDEEDKPMMSGADDDSDDDDDSGDDDNGQGEPEESEGPDDFADGGASNDHGPKDHHHNDGNFEGDGDDTFDMSQWVSPGFWDGLRLASTCRPASKIKSQERCDIHTALRRPAERPPWMLSSSIGPSSSTYTSRNIRDDTIVCGKCNRGFAGAHRFRRHAEHVRSAHRTPKDSIYTHTLHSCAAKGCNKMFYCDRALSNDVRPKHTFPTTAEGTERNEVYPCLGLMTHSYKSSSGIDDGTRQPELFEGHLSRPPKIRRKFGKPSGRDSYFTKPIYISSSRSNTVHCGPPDGHSSSPHSGTAHITLESPLTLATMATTASDIKQLRNLIRTRYALDIEIWSTRGRVSSDVSCTALTPIRRSRSPENLPPKNTSTELTKMIVNSELVHCAYLLNHSHALDVHGMIPAPDLWYTRAWGVHGVEIEVPHQAPHNNYIRNQHNTVVHGRIAKKQSRAYRHKHLSTNRLMSRCRCLKKNRVHDCFPRRS